LKLAFQADANLDPDIWRGLRRREPRITFRGHSGVIPDAMQDRDVLHLAADAGLVLVSEDVRTMPGHFDEFIAERSSPGLILVPSSRSMGSAIESLLFVWWYWTPEQLHNRRVWLPTVA
jgi:hypothetical protein